MKRIIILSAFAFVFIFTSSLNAQIFRIGLGGGLTMVQSPDYLTSETNGAGLSTEFHIGAKAKFDLPMVPITPVGFVNYHFMNGSTSIMTVNGTTASADVSTNILSIGAGGEFSIIPVPGPINPYLALDLAYNYFGDITVNNFTLQSSASRVGLAVGAGASFSMIALPELDLSVKYNMVNLIGKEDGEDTISTINISAFILF